MKAQLTELLTGYGPVRAIWFDGHWDQDRNPDFDWRYDELYSLVHSLQPACLVGNNHHLNPFPGEDIQIFERDLPGENSAGLSGQDVSLDLPLETCQTMNGMWGYKITDQDGTRGGEMTPRDWGVMTRKGNVRYVHIMNLKDNTLFVPLDSGKVIKAVCLNDGTEPGFLQDNDGVLLKLGRIPTETDMIIELTLEEKQKGGVS